ncbi:MAG: NUDIX hydrolase [Peptococcaceae bacterium]|nr:NUDIX hydrolase [Peptococcaceae bacterium]
MEDSMIKEKCLSRDIVYQGKIITVNYDTVLLPDGKISGREVVHHPGAVAVVPCTADKILMVKQYRYAIGRETLEIPAGKIDPGEQPEICALRELREETGYSGSLSYLGAYYSSPGFTDEAIHLYLAENLYWSPLETDEEEFLQVASVPRAEVLELIQKGEIQDGKSVLGILLAHLAYFADY